MRHMSAKTSKRYREVKKIRAELVKRRGECAVCSLKDGQWGTWDGGKFQVKLCCHEIANGPDRQKALDKPFAILVLCQKHHEEVQNWKKEKQLALLSISGFSDYDLRLYHETFCPNAPNRYSASDVLDEVQSLMQELYHV